MAKETKTQIAIRVMKANVGKTMSEVVPLLMDACDLSEKNARVCYSIRVKADPTLGTIETKTRTVRAEKPKAPKLIKVPKPKVQGDKPKVTDKTVEELEDIRKKNLARLKAVGRTYAKGRAAEPRFSDEAFDENAVPNLEAELDSFKAPAFLNKDQVKALV
jgi:hypothetical protein